jgi:hypothetical protein
LGGEGACANAFAEKHTAAKMIKILIVISPSPSFLYQLEKAKAALNNISSGVGM